MPEWNRLDEAGRENLRASIVSLGCAKNLVDSEMMAAQLVRLGFTVTEAQEEAWLLVVNTCGFLESAVEEAIQNILELASHKVNGRCGCLVATGCMVQRYGRKLLPLLPEVDLFLGTSDLHRLDEALLDWQAGTQPGPPRARSGRRLDEALPDGQPERRRRLWIGPPRHLCDSRAPRARSTPAPSAYIKIAEGCDNRCTYCMIPRLRGPFRSRTREDVVREAAMLAAQGVREVTLIAQDTTAFGLDRGEREGLARLIECLEDVDGLRWVRLLYVYPDRINKGLLTTMAQSTRVVPYLDVPLQHCEPRILAAMGRSCPRSGVEPIIDLVRTSLPQVVLRTSLMVGFPGETESDFARLVGFVERMAFDHVGVFSFSPEVGSRAARMGAQVSGEVKEARRRVLMEAQTAISRKKLQSLVGRIMPVLVEGLHPETDLLLRGRLPSQAPEVDGMVMITEGKAVVGEIRSAEITAAHDYDVEARLPDSHQPSAGE